MKSHFYFLLLSLQSRPITYHSWLTLKVVSRKTLKIFIVINHNWVEIRLVFFFFQIKHKVQKQSSKLQQSDKCKQSCPELCKNQKVQTQVEILRDKCFHEITFKNIEVDLPENDVCGINYNDTHLALCVCVCVWEREKERERERERDLHNIFLPAQFSTVLGWFRGFSRCACCSEFDGLCILCWVGFGVVKHVCGAAAFRRDSFFAQFVYWGDLLYVLNIHKTFGLLIRYCLI